MKPAPQLQLRDVALSFPGHPDVLAGVSFTLPGPGLYVLIGPNAAGKSSLLNVLAGLLRPDAGRVFVGGEDLARLSATERARRIALVPQFVDTGVPLLVEDMVALGRLHALSWRARLSTAGLGAEDLEAVRASLVATDTEALRHRTFASLSGGERARVRLAMALAQASPILLLDEPTAHADLGYTREILERLRQEAIAGRLVLAVLHDLTLAALYADHVLVLDHGRLALEGEPATVFTDPELERVFRTAFAIVRHPETGTPILVPSTGRARAATEDHLPLSQRGGSG